MKIIIKRSDTDSMMLELISEYTRQGFITRTLWAVVHEDFLGIKSLAHLDVCGEIEAELS